MASSDLTISVIIPTLNRRDDLIAAVESLLRQSREPEELIIVDQSKGEESERAVERLFAGRKGETRLVYVHDKNITGLTQARNIGISRSLGNIIFFFDDDVVLEQEYLENVVKVFEQDHKGTIGAVYGRIIHPNRNRPFSLKQIIMETGYRMITEIFLLTKSGSGRFRMSGFPTHPHPLIKGRYVECLSGACMAFRRTVFQDISFDENLTGYAYMEDSDISKMLSAHYKIYYEPSARLKHNVSPRGRLNRYEVSRMLVVNHYYLSKKNWPQNIARKAVFWWSIIGLIIRGIYPRNCSQVKGTIAGILDIFSERNELILKAKGKKR